MIIKSIVALAAFASCVALAADPVSFFNCSYSTSDDANLSFGMSAGGKLAKGTILLNVNGRPVQTMVLDAQHSKDEAKETYSFKLDAEGVSDALVTLSSDGYSLSINGKDTYQCNGNMADELDKDVFEEIVADHASRPVLFSCTYNDLRGAGATLLVKQGATGDQILVVKNGSYYDMRLVAEASRQDKRPDGGKLRYGFTFLKDRKKTGSLVLEMIDKKGFVRIDESQDKPTRECSYVDPDKFGFYETDLDSVVNFVARLPK